MNVVYKLTFPSGKSYVGKTTKGFNRRFKQHISNAINNRGKSPCVEAAIRKYGVDSIITEVIMVCDEDDDISIWEIAFIDEFNTMAPNGYNLTEGGDGSIGHKFTTEYKLNKSKYMRKLFPDKHLEMYVKYHKTSPTNEGFRVQRPGYKTIQFCSSALTMDEKLELANNYAKSLDRGEIITKERYGYLGLGIIPMGIVYNSYCDGFSVCIKGQPIKSFKKQSLTRDQKYQLALKYYNEQLKSSTAEC